MRLSGRESDGVEKGAGTFLPSVAIALKGRLQLACFV